MTILALWIKHGHSLRKLIFRKMMIADDHVYAFTAGILDLLIGLDTAVEGDDQTEAVFCRPVYAFV